MRWHVVGLYLLSFIALSTGCTQAASAQLERPAGVVVGTVFDPTGAVIPAASVHAERHASNVTIPNILADGLGSYKMPLALGTYDITITADGFDPYVRTVRIRRAGEVVKLDASMVIATKAEIVTVNSNSSAGAGDNLSALVLGPKELETMSDNDDTFQQQVQALAGGDPMQPSSMYVDGFSSGQIPPKDTIREIRINSNPFSAQYPELGFGRIEIFTKPGSDTLHANISVFANNSPFNAQNPLSTTQPPYYMLNIRGNVGGPIGKKTSYFVNVRYNDAQNNSVINALASESGNVPVNLVVPSPMVSQSYTLRLDRQVTANNVFTARWEFQHTSLRNCGLSGCTPGGGGEGSQVAAISAQILPSEAFNGGSNMSTLQLSDSQSIGKNKVLETRFQWIRSRGTQDPISTDQTVNVSGFFNGGGNPSQTLIDHTDKIEFQEYFSLEHGQHFFRIGGRYRGTRDANFSNANFQGNITYSAYTPAGGGATTDALTNYNNGAPSQFIANAGNPKATIYTGDLGIYADDEYKVRKDVTLNYGVRLESQSGIPDHFDPAPRLGVAWDVGKTDKRAAFVTLRAGFGLFYDRFAADNLLTAIREKQGGLQQQYIFTLPGNVTSQCTTTGTVPTCSGFTAAAPTTYSVSPHLRSQYDIVEGLTAEKQLRRGRISVNYLHLQSAHQWISRNVNAPLPGTYNPSNPNSGTQSVYQFDSNATKETNLVFANAQYAAGKRLNLWVSGTERFENSDTSGAGSFPTDQYNLKADYGRVASPHLRLFTGGSLDLPWGILLNPFVAITSEQPFNITTGTDLNGDTQFNDRPSFATSASPAASVFATKYGRFNAAPVAGETIVPINYANGPRFVYAEMYASKSFRFGPGLPASPAPKAVPGKPAPKPVPPVGKYRLTFAVEIDNVFNHPNLSVPIGVLTSPDFGKSLSLNSTFIGSPNANRMIFVATSFHF